MNKNAKMQYIWISVFKSYLFFEIIVASGSKLLLNV